MQMNHHILAKTTTDSILYHFKEESWNCCNGIGKDFFRVTTDASFPSPDASFYDEENKFLVSFEFKPPTETKRGILTGVGQSIAYLRECNASYLIAPERLEDYNLGEFLTDLFRTQITGKIPAGLILYKNEAPEEVTLVANIDPTLALKSKKEIKAKGITTSRFWAKHQDLPIALFHLLLHCYFLKKSHTIEGDAFKYCWKEHMISKTILEDFQPKVIYDCANQPIKTPAGNKNLMILEKILKKQENAPLEKKISLIQHEIDTEFTGDNKYNAYKKNFVTFLKHLKVIDSVGELTDEGFKLYHLGLTNGANSKVFRNYFTREVLMTGHHLDLILDLDKVMRFRKELSFNACLAEMEEIYEEKGFIKRNPNRIASESNTVGFLKYECILWRSLGLLKEDDSNPNRYYINWKAITEICSLPDL